MQNYSDLFFYFRFDDDYSCKHRFLNHALVYVYCGELEITASDGVITVESGEAAFVCKDTCMQMDISRKNKEEAKIAILRIPESFLREFYFTVEKQENVFHYSQSFIILHSATRRCRQLVLFDAALLRNERRTWR